MRRYQKKLSIRNLLSNAIVYERESTQDLRGLCPDPVTGLIWAYSEKDLYVVRTTLPRLNIGPSS